MPLELRPVRPDDAEAIAAIANASLPERWSAPAFRAEIEARGAVGFAAVDETGALVGYALGARTGAELEVRSLAVAPAHRRLGLGARLLDALLEAERSCGGSDAVLEVRRSNAPAMRLYARAGFEACGERPRYYADGESAVVMAVRLCRA
jgi:ribosomal-protein-alanine acetyltransferase